MPESLPQSRTTVDERNEIENNVEKSFRGEGAKQGYSSRLPRGTVALCKLQPYLIILIHRVQVVDYLSKLSYLLAHLVVQIRMKLRHRC